MHGLNGVTVQKTHRNAFFEFSLSILGFSRRSKKSASQAGLTLIEYDLLLALSAYPQNTCQSIAILCDSLLIQHHVGSETVSRLAARSLLKTKQNDHDRRSVILSLTGRGELLLRQIALQNLEHLLKHGQQIESSLASLMRNGLNGAKDHRRELLKGLRAGKGRSR
jgi:DNA-binding MarR family transcriptional regulator